MNTKIVYTLTSNDADLYLEQLFVSMHSLRQFNSSAKICLVIDMFTDRTLIGHRQNLTKYVDEKIVVNIPSRYNKIQASRFLKTSLRKYIKGDYLFIDSDTIVCGSLDSVDNLECEIGAVYDLHCNFQDNILLKRYRSRLSQYFDYDADNLQEYYNSGIMYVKDSRKTHEFYDLWHKNWEKGVAMGLNYDQTSLAVTNKELNFLITKIPDIYNCQIRFSIKYLHDAKILHYFSARDNDISPIFSKSFFKQIKEIGDIPTSYSSYFIHPKESFNILTITNSGEAAQLCDTINSRFINNCLYLLSRHPKLFTLIDLLIRALRKVSSTIIGQR